MLVVLITGVDSEQEDMLTCKCSTCNTAITGKRYKCASCKKFNLCRACYRFSGFHLLDIEYHLPAGHVFPVKFMTYIPPMLSCL